MLKFLLTGKKTPKAQAPADGEAKTPAYYEVWGGLESANRALWVGLWISCTFTLLSLLLLRNALGRPPVVLDIGPDGQTRILSPGTQSSSAQTSATEAEVKNFVTLFERFFTELNCYTADSGLKQAFTMMTPGFRQKAENELKSSGIVDKLKAMKERTALTLTEIDVKTDTPQVLEVRVKGYRDISSYLP
ncbi:MAG: hypothetical protein KGI84_06490, partial [Elusimicrobia bacterium]|nr:hypothetical protein [Elusimicrobiota bacterium]